ncbi:hypothetical protein NUW54_g9886 [Trametes sanguinea]|uniref:Uncharacterized protein n=1 Tax=Trametes sanguinea TaxID=158606 RepID=A0ACC1P5X8_9APHY|nr:hypothetical protein NUW54_g9886 [Trametes sanguinea]
MFPLALSLPLSLAFLVSARVHHSRVPEDPYAFPKYSVSFLHGLPVLNETAERWLRDGLRGGELEFLDEPWQESQWHASQRKSIEAGDDSAPSDVCHNVPSSCFSPRALILSMRSQPRALGRGPTTRCKRCRMRSSAPSLGERERLKI